MNIFSKIQDPKKFTRSFITTEKGFNDQIRRISFKSGTQHSENFFEVNKVPPKITERFPLHAGNCVLHLSKLILGRFVVFLHDHLISDSYSFIYTGNKYILIINQVHFFLDTDSMALCFIDDMDKLVKSDMRKSWLDKKSKIFVLDENDPADLRYPGKWKQEFTTKNGAIIM